MTAIVNQQDYVTKTGTTTTFTESTPVSLSFTELSGTDLDFMPVTFDTTTYETQTGTTTDFTNLTSTVLSFTEQTSTSVSYEAFSKIDGTLYGYEEYGEGDYAGRPFFLGRTTDG